MTAATPAQNAASLGNLAARTTATADELKKMRERLNLNDGVAELKFAAAVMGANICTAACRWLEKWVRREVDD